mmetsp:Transcript_84238/g.153853  ORF Transcript_84238/g.153853 Transcript_84238/m.153853 type:complete len:186 (+) Transcript_84238:80-637(+)
MSVMHLLLGACSLSTTVLVVQAQCGDPPAPKDEDLQCYRKTGLDYLRKFGACTFAEMYVLPPLCPSAKCKAGYREAMRHAGQECLGDKYPGLREFLLCQTEHMCDGARSQAAQLWSFSTVPYRADAQHPKTDSKDIPGFKDGMLVAAIAGGILGSMLTMVSLKLAAKYQQATTAREALISDCSLG